MKLAAQLSVSPKAGVRLAACDPDDTCGVDREAAERSLEKNTKRLLELQYCMYAEGRHALLIILQGMDAAGKDGVIRHVITGLNPQGCRVTSFKQPSAEELQHDFLWRIHAAVPRLGEIGVFNRSHYEDVLVVRVHDLVPPAVWKQRYGQIRDFERMLTATGTTVVKFFLHISRDEQRERLQARLRNPERNWKFSSADLRERAFWRPYVRAYEDALNECSSREAPWYVIPANHKWFRDFAVSQILLETLGRLDMKYPKPKEDLSRVRVE